MTPRASETSQRLALEVRRPRRRTLLGRPRVIESWGRQLAQHPVLISVSPGDAGTSDGKTPKSQEKCSAHYNAAENAGPADMPESLGPAAPKTAPVGTRSRGYSRRSITTRVESSLRSRQQLSVSGPERGRRGSKPRGLAQPLAGSGELGRPHSKNGPKWSRFRQEIGGMVPRGGFQKCPRWGMF